MLRLDLKVGESLKIGDAVLTLEEKSGQRARFAIEADRSIPIARIQRASSATIAAQRGISGEQMGVPAA